MAQIFEGQFNAAGMKIGIVASRFNELITKALLEGALNELRRIGISETGLDVVWVPGAYEIPVACQQLINTRPYDALITVGCLIRGETSHYEHIAQSVTNSLQDLAIANRIPIGFGVLTVEHLNQAFDRAGGKHGNKGRDAARSALEMANLFRSLQADSKEEIRRIVHSEIKP